MDDTTEILHQNIQLFSLRFVSIQIRLQKSCSGQGKLPVHKVHSPSLYNRGERHTVVTLVASDVCFPPALRDYL